MADVLYELEYSVNTTGLDKGEARLKRYDQAMERSSERARRLERDLSSIGSGGGRGVGGMVRSSGGARGSILTSTDRDAQRYVRAEVRARDRIDRENDRIARREFQRQQALGRERTRQERDLARFRDQFLRRQAQEQRRDQMQRYGLEQRIAAVRTQVNAGGSYGGLAALGGGILGLGGLVLGGLSRFGDTAIQGMGERDTALRQYTALMGGDRDRAGLEYYRAQQFARRTDFTESAVTKAQSGLVAQGFRGDELYRTLFAAADLSSLSGDDKSEALKGVVRALGQIKAKGRLQAEEINQISEHAPLARGAWMEEIRRGMGLKDLKAVEKKMQKGEVTADVGISAFQRATLSQLGTDKLGQFSTQSAGSLTSLLSNLQEAQSMLAKSFDSETLPAVARFKQSLGELGAAFDVNTKRGEDLAYVYKDIANTAIEAKSQWAQFKSSFLSTFADSYRREKERQNANVDLELRAARMKDASDQFGKNIGLGGGAAASMRSPSEFIYSVQSDVNALATAWRNWRSGKASFFSSSQRSELLPSVATPSAEQERVFKNRSSLMDGVDSQRSRYWSPLNATPYGPPGSAKETAVEKLARLRSRRATRVAVAGAASAGSSGSAGETAAGGDDHSVRIGTQVTIQGGLTVQVTVPAQPGMTPQAMSAMIGDSVRDALLREVGRGARRPRV